MSLFSSPAAVRAPPEPQPDPQLKAQRETIAAETNAANTRVAEAARRRFTGRTMGTQGANALFTAGPMGYPAPTMGNANV